MGPICNAIPSAFARVRSTPSVCGWQSAAAKKPRLRARAIATHMPSASAAALASSSKDAFATGRPVRSAISVWKFSNASSRPCEISLW